MDTLNRAAPALIKRAGLRVLPAFAEHDAPCVRGFCTTRLGGVSRGAHDSLNLGTLAGDAPAAVAENRRRLRAALPSDPFWLKQVHGTTVLDADDPRFLNTELPRDADAAVTATKQRVLAVLTADCLPVILSDLDAQVLGVAHAGWRGLATGVLENTLAALRARCAAARGWQAWIGPGIGSHVFEVGADVRAAFVGADSQAQRAFVAPPDQPPGKWLANLAELAAQRLQRAGVTNIRQTNLCTYTRSELFFSYRRDGITGRMATCAWLEP